MKDVLLLTMLRALDARDTGTANSCVGLASDPEALGVLLADDYSEGYTPDEYDLLTEAQRSLLVKQIVTDKNGNKVTRWVRGGGTFDDAKADPSVQRAQMIRPGAGVKGDPKATPKGAQKRGDADPTPKAEPKPEPKRDEPKLTAKDLKYLPKDPKRLTFDQAAQAAKDLGIGEITGQRFDQAAKATVVTVRQPDGSEVTVAARDLKKAIYQGQKLAGATDGGRTREAVEDYGDTFAEVEEYEDHEYNLLTEAERAGFVKKTGTDSRGRKYTRWVRAEQPKADRKAVAAESKAKAKAMIESGVKGAAQARVLASHLKNLTVADIDELRKLHAVKASGRIKQAKVDTLVAYAQGRGSVEQAKAAVKPEMPKPSQQPRPADTPEQIKAAVRSELRAMFASDDRVYIPTLRAAISAKHGPDADAEVFAALNSLRLGDEVRVVPVDDLAQYPPEDLRQGYKTPVGILMYVRKGDNFGGQ